MSDEEYDDRELELALPFLCVQSKGGPFDDDSFVSGIQFGMLMSKLDNEHLMATTEMVHEALVPTLDLLAMKEGFVMTVLHETDGWAHVGFTRPSTAGDPIAP